MKKIALLFFLLIGVQALNAQKYGYISKDDVYKAMPEYDSATVQIEKTRKEYENLLASMQGELSSKTVSLNNESATISDYVRQSRQEEIKNLNVRIQLFSVRATAQLEDRKNQLLKPIIEKVDKAIKSVAEEQGLVFVIDREQLFYTDDKKCTNIMPLVKVKLGVK